MSELILTQADLPPLVLSLSHQDAEKIDWASPQVVDPNHIGGVRSTVESRYPQRKTAWASSPYPDKDLKRPPAFYARTHSYAKWTDDKTFHHYNPFVFRIPFRLIALDHFFNSAFFCSGSFVPPGSLRREMAAEQYLNFLREYHLLYADILEAMNGSSEAKNRIRTKVDTNEMYQNAGINTGNLVLPNNIDNASIEFRQSLLAYLVMDILRSTDPNISTAARVKALELLYTFNIDSIATAFSEHLLGFRVFRDEPVEDLIPRSFMTTAEEKGGTPHNDLFRNNSTIRDVFNMKPRSNDMDFDAGLSVLLRRYPQETVQVLISLLRSDIWGWRMDTKLTFHALVNLSRLDSIQKGQLFGAKASYRADCQLAGVSGLQSRVGATTGIGSGFGDGLERLSREELITRLRQHQNYEKVLEQLVATGAAKTATTNVSFSDPKGYFGILGLDSTIGENFDLLLTACYRTMARKLHPDKPEGSNEEFKKIQHAYDVLSNLDSRNEYLASGRHR